MKNAKVYKKNIKIHSKYKKNITNILKISINYAKITQKVEPNNQN